MTHVVVFLRTSAEILLAEARREVRSGVEGHRSGLACRWRRVSRQLETMHDKHARSPFFSDLTPVFIPPPRPPPTPPPPYYFRPIANCRATADVGAPAG